MRLEAVVIFQGVLLRQPSRWSLVYMEGNLKLVGWKKESVIYQMGLGFSLWIVFSRSMN